MPIDAISFDPYQPPEAAIGESAGVNLDEPPGNPWLTIWIRPRRTIRRIIDDDPKRHILILEILSGIGWCLAAASGSNRGEKPTTARILLEVFLGGPLLGVFLVTLISFAIRWTGKWIGGRGGFAEVRAGMAWAGVGLIPLILVDLIAIAVLGDSLFARSLRRGLPQPEFLAHLFVLVANRLLMFWYLILWFKCVAEAHRFSVLKAIGAAFLFVAVWEVVFLIVYGVAYLLGLTTKEDRVFWLAPITASDLQRERESRT